MANLMKNIPIKKWIDSRNSREGSLVLAIVLAFIYFIWTLLFYMPLHGKMISLNNQEQQLLTQLNQQEQQAASLEQMISSSSFLNQLATQKKLIDESKEAHKHFETIALHLVSRKDLPKMMNAILNQQTGIILTSMKTFPEEHWKGPQIDGLSFPNEEDIYKYSIQIDFQGSYFSTIDFLSYLESLSWHFYWDSLEYKVLNYPEAEVTLRLHVLKRSVS